MKVININNQFVFKTKDMRINCYSVNPSVWKYLDKLFLKSLWLNTGKLTLKDNMCFIEVFKSVFNANISTTDGRKIKNIRYLSIWHLVEYIEKYATIDQYQKLALSLYTHEGI